MITDLTSNNNLQEKILALTSALDLEVSQVKTELSVDEMKSGYEQVVKSLSLDVQIQLDELSRLQVLRILEIEKKLGYLIELCASQQLMMEDILIYLKELEQPKT